MPATSSSPAAAAEEPPPDTPAEPTTQAYVALAAHLATAPPTLRELAHSAGMDEESIEEMRARLRRRLYAGQRPLGLGKDIPYPRTATAQQIAAAVIAQPNWAVRGLLPQGAAILAGKPKAGKSWLCLNIALATAQDSLALDALPVSPGDVLYIALEDTGYRLQQRINAARASAPPPPNLFFTTRWPRLPDGLAALKHYLADHPSTRLVIIDTLAKIRPLATSHANAYEEDYALVGALKDVADSCKTTILLVHHLRKAAMDDPMDAVSGSAGLTGAADTILVLSRRRAATAARLFAAGRDIDEQDLTLLWVPSPTGWTIAERADAATDGLSPIQADLLDTLAATPAGCTPQELADLTGHPPSTVRVSLHRLTAAGRVAKRDGRYTPRSLAAPAQPRPPPPEPDWSTAPDPEFDSSDDGDDE